MAASSCQPAAMLNDGRRHPSLSPGPQLLRQRPRVTAQGNEP